MTQSRDACRPLLTRRTFAKLAGAAGCFWALPGQAGAATCADAQAVRSAADALIAAARTGSPETFASVFRTYADAGAITTFALGKHARSLPAARHSELVNLTVAFVSRTFNDFRQKFQAASVEVGDCRGSIVESVLKFRGQQGKQAVLWRMQGGRVVDVNIQNLWLGQLLRDEFNSAIAAGHGDIEALFTRLGK